MIANIIVVSAQAGTQPSAFSPARIVDTGRRRYDSKGG